MRILIMKNGERVKATKNMAEASIELKDPDLPGLG